MNVLFVQGTSHREGHFGDYIAHICHELGCDGHDVTLCTDRLDIAHYLSATPRFQLHEVAGGKYDFHEVETNKNRFPFYYQYGYLRNSYLVLNEALRLLRKKNFDILHITGIEFLAISILLSRHRGPLPPVIVEVYAANWTCYPGNVLRKSYKSFQREIFRKRLGNPVQAIVTLGQWHVDRLREQLRLGPDFPIRVVTEGVEIPPPCSREEARKRIGLAGYTGTVFLFFGTIRRDKNIFSLLEATQKLKEQDFRVVVAGAPTHFTAAEVESSIAELGVANRVLTRLDYIPDEEMSDYYFSADVVVLPYARIYAGGSGPLRKACAHGRPLIVANVSEMGRLTAASELGLVAEAENSTDLAAKMSEFMALPSETKARFASNAMAIADENSWGTMARSFSALYRDLRNEPN